MIGTAQSVQGRSRASRGWLAALALGVALAFGAGTASAATHPVTGPAGIGKKKDGLFEKAATLSSDKKKDGLSEKVASLTGDKAKKDDGLDKDTMSQTKGAGLDAIKSPEIKTGGEGPKKP
jgi:hypothetical protein